jgi:hypothetical protein
MSSERKTVIEAYAELEAAHAKIATASYDKFSETEALTFLDRREAVYRSQPAVDSPAPPSPHHPGQP